MKIRVSEKKFIMASSVYCCTITSDNKEHLKLFSPKFVAGLCSLSPGIMYSKGL